MVVGCKTERAWQKGMAVKNCPTPWQPEAKTAERIKEK